MQKIIRRTDLKAVVGISPSSVDRLIQAGSFPRKRRWSQGITGWKLSEIEEWIESNGEVI
jgi:prophage regulatory protein